MKKISETSYTNWRGSFKKSFSRFSENTTAHGFRELYHAKSKFWAIVWLVLLCASAGFLSYQLKQVIDQYSKQPTNTVIAPAREKEILYPPLRLCYRHWLYWVDWNKTEQLGFSKEATLYGLSFFHTIYTVAWLNVSESKADFKKTMNENGLKRISDFFQAISREVPIEVDVRLKNRIGKKIGIYYEYPGYIFCYEKAGQDFFDYFTTTPMVLESNDGRKLVHFQLVDQVYGDSVNCTNKKGDSCISNIVTELEYNRYMHRWIEHKSLYRINNENANTYDLTDFSPPVGLYPNGFSMDTVVLYKESDVYFVEFTASVRTFQSTIDTPCVVGQRSFASNYTCLKYCRAVRDRHCACRSLQLAVLLGEDDQLEVLCQHEIFLIRDVSPLNDTLLQEKDGDKVVPSTENRECHLDDPSVQREYEKCKEKCVPACEIWRWEFTVAVSTIDQLVRNIGHKDYTNITVEYPVESRILVMTEVPSITWDNVVGNIGGILGVWSGASILSLFQLVYLCFFEDSAFDPFNYLAKMCRQFARSSNGRVYVVSKHNAFDSKEYSLTELDMPKAKSNIKQ